MTQKNVKNFPTIIRKTAELIPYARNSRTHSDEQINQVAASIKEFGFTNPIIVDADGGIIAGHCRVLAAKKLKIEAVPCVLVSGWSEAQKKAYVIADNKLALNSSWDEEMLSLEFADLKELGFDIALTGFDIQEVGAFTRTYDPKSEEYTSKIETPVYKITGEKPEIETLFDESATQILLGNIEKSNVSPAEKQFLIAGAQRHTVMNFKNIAEYYAHASKEMQELMEQQALVIIDFKKAIEQGYIELSEDVANQFVIDKPELVTEDE